MKFIVGLGNPGKEYLKTRHNIGFQAVDHFAQTIAEDRGQHTSPAFQFKQKFFAEVMQIGEIMFIKPQTFMNDSGRAVRAVIDFYQKSLLSDGSKEIKDLYVIHDDLDLVTGSYKIQFGKGPKVHNGLTSIYNTLHTKDFWHVRLGVDSRNGDRSVPSQNYVLSPFLLAERQSVEVMFKAAEADIAQHLKN
jgi:PTH1 family peptidyl-tRNA hydrolase